MDIIKNVYSIYTISSGIEIDSRKVKNGSIFFSLKGKRFNGNKFASEAISKGAILSIIDDKKYFFSCNKKMIFVHDSLLFLQKLAMYHRYKNKNIPIIVIAGSNGKTTTKELIKEILKKKYNKVHFTKENFNNHIGIPLTILSISRNTQISVIEIGANHKNEIKNMCNIVYPNYGYITNFGKAHLEGFLSEQGVITSKLELYNFLRKKNGLVFINGDDPIQNINSIYMKKFIFSSYKDQVSDIKFKYFFNSIGKNLKKSFLLFNNIKIISPLIGDYNLYNIAASVTIGIYFKVSLIDIKNAVEKYIPNNYRSQIIKKKNKKIFLDCYNANPTSMIKSLNFFVNNINGKKIIILGDMLELGKYSIEEHEKIIFFLMGKNIISYLIGKNFFYSKNINHCIIKKFLIKKDFAKWIKKNPINNIDYILIKGSRKMKLEDIIPLI